MPVSIDTTMAIGIWVVKPIDPPSAMVVRRHEQTTTAQSDHLLDDVVHPHHTITHMPQQTFEAIDPGAAQIDAAREALLSEVEIEVVGIGGDLGLLHVHTHLGEIHMVDHLQGRVDILGLL